MQEETQQLVSPLLDKAEACKYLKMSIATLDRRVADGAIAVCPLGKKLIKFLQKDLDAYIAAIRKPSIEETLSE